jgi:flagellar protein FlaG
MDITGIYNTQPMSALAAAPVTPDRLSANREIIQAVQALNGAELLGSDNELTFGLDRDTQRPVIRLVNRKTNEVIRQVPPEYVLRMASEVRRA